MDEQTQEEKKFLNLEDILNADDLHPEDVHVPEWGGWVRVRPLTGEELGDFIDMVGGKSKEESPMRLLMCTVIDPKTGQNLFPRYDSGLEARKLMSRLKKKSLSAFMKVQGVAMRISGLSDAEQATVKKD